MTTRELAAGLVPARLLDVAESDAAETLDMCSACIDLDDRGTTLRTHTCVQSLRAGDVITENMGAYRIDRHLGGTRYSVTSAVSNTSLEIDTADSGYREPRNAWRVLSRGRR